MESTGGIRWSRVLKWLWLPFIVLLGSGTFVLRATPKQVSKSWFYDGARMLRRAKAMRGKGKPVLLECVFCLDSTGSMTGVIQAAKNTIWSMANVIFAGEPAPIVRFCVVTYRDRGDEYELKTIKLTEDIDAVHEFLTDISAAGGGDGPENVRLALKTAVESPGWSKDKEAIKAIFLVGDARPHEDYGDLPSCSQTAAKAAARGIIINTIACGGMEARGHKIFKAVAERTGGEFQKLSGAAANSQGFQKVILASLLRRAKEKGMYFASER